MNAWVRDQVGLEFVEVDVEGAIESERSSDRRNDLAEQSVQIFVRGSRNAQVLLADIVDRLIVNHECAVGMFKSSMGGENGIVRLDNSSGHLRCWVNGKLELRFFAIVNGETFHEEGGEAGAGAAAK